EVPRDLETICHKCLRKEPGERYATAGELAQELRRFQSGEPIKARPVGGVERLAKWARRRPAPAAVYALLPFVLLLGAGGGSAFWLWQQAEDERKRAQEQHQQAEKERQRAETAEGEALSRQKELEQTLGKLRRTQQALEKTQAESEHLSYMDRLDAAQLLWEAGACSKAGELLERCPPQY